MTFEINYIRNCYIYCNQLTFQIKQNSKLLQQIQNNVPGIPLDSPTTYQAIICHQLIKKNLTLDLISIFQNQQFQKYEYVWKTMFVAISIVAAVLFKKVYIFQTHQYFKDIRCGGILQMIIYGLPYGALFTAMDLLIHYMFDDLCAKYYITEERYTDPESKKKRCYTLVKWGYSIIYYLFSSIWAYLIMRNTHFMPTWLGGLGSPLSMLESAPRIPEVTFEMKVFYILQFGKHASRFFSHVFIRAEGNFFEYALHHGLSVFLIIFSYLSNQWLIGIFVLLIHDYSDFALIMARAYKDCKNMVKRVLDLIYVHAMISWVGCRIILFSYCCIYASFYGLFYATQNLSQLQLEVLYFPYWFMAIMMVGLQILHLFWTYYIAESFVSVKITPKVVHSYD